MYPEISEVVKSAIVNHDEKTVTFVSPSGEQSVESFDSYDEWNCTTLGGVEFDYHFLNDEEQCVFAYGTKVVENGCEVIDFSNDKQLVVTEVGSYED